MKKPFSNIILPIIIIIALICAACTPLSPANGEAPSQTMQNTQDVASETAPDSTSGLNNESSAYDAGLALRDGDTLTKSDSEGKMIEGDLRVTVVSVGKGDCMIISTPDGKNMLLDAGDPPDAKKILKYMKKAKINKLDMVIATHPHSDHIGGMEEVLKAKEWDNLYMPNQSHTSKTYLDLLEYLKGSGKNIVQAKAGLETKLGEYCSIKFFSPDKEEYENLNESSAVFKLTFGESSFFFMGDAEKANEEYMLANFKNELKADVLKVGHHGSSTSTSREFLSEVAPAYAIITTGKKNPYGHPHKETVESLEKYGVYILRTDEMGNIEIYSDGNNYHINKEK